MAKYHYVYALTSPLDYGKPFYIGKGSGDRRVEHFRSVSKEMAGGEASDKFKIIQKIRDAGLQPSAIVLSHHDDEEDALTEERRVIKDIGLDNLVNKSIGGEGVKAKTKTKSNGVSAVRALTGKQEKFAQLVASGSSLSDAYRGSFNVSKMKPATVNREAHALMDNHKITTRVNELRAPVVAEARVDLAYCIQGQKDAAALATETGNAGALTGAYRELGKLTDVYPSDKSEVTIRGDELATRLQHGRARLLMYEEES